MIVCENHAPSGSKCEFDKDNNEVPCPYCTIERLTEEVEELERQVCDECLVYEDDGTPQTSYGWNENRVEGQCVCACISESGPYQVLDAQVETLRENLKQVGRYCTGEDQIDLAFDDTEALGCIAKYIEQALKEIDDENRQPESS